MIEGIIRRKLGGRGMEFAIMGGWILIAALFALTMWNDIVRLIG
jgi:membrane-associated protease RseP (regulator of RpoE activity)